MEIYKFPINRLISYNFIAENNLDYGFFDKEISEYKKGNLNLSFWNNLYGIEDNNKSQNGETEEEIIGLLEELDEDVDDRLEEYKGKRDLLKIKNIIEFLKKIELRELIYILDGIYNETFMKKNLIITNRTVNNNFKYILSEYKSLVDTIKEDIELKEMIINKEDNNISYKDILNKFIQHFTDFEIQISGCNQEKDHIINQVYLAKAGDKEAKEYIIGKIIKNEAEKIAKRFAYKSNKTQAEKKQLENDLTQEAILSSITGLYKYDIKKNDNFIYYIRFWIKQGIHKGLENQYNEIKIPSYIIQLFSKIKNISANGETSETDIEKIVLELNKEHLAKIDKKIKDLKIASKKTKGIELEKIKREILDLEEMKKDKSYKNGLAKKVKNAMDKINSNSVYSIGTLLKNLDDDAEGGGMEANILIDENVDIERNLRNAERTQELKTLLEETLTEEEYLTIKHEFGLFGADELLLSSVGKMLNVTAERVRQIRRNVKEKLAIKEFDKAVGQLNKNRKFLRNS